MATVEDNNLTLGGFWLLFVFVWCAGAAWCVFRGCGVEMGSIEHLGSGGWGCSVPRVVVGGQVVMFRRFAWRWRSWSRLRLVSEGWGQAGAGRGALQTGTARRVDTRWAALGESWPPKTDPAQSAERPVSLLQALRAGGGSCPAGCQGNERWGRDKPIKTGLHVYPQHTGSGPKRARLTQIQPISILETVMVLLVLLPMPRSRIPAVRQIAASVSLQTGTVSASFC